MSGLIVEKLAFGGANVFFVHGCLGTSCKCHR